MRSALFAFVLMIAGTACSSDSTSPNDAKAGTYTLLSVNGSNVPVVTTENASIKTEILSGTLVIGSDGTFSESRAGRVTLSGGTPSAITSTQGGTWAETGGVMTFTAGTVSSPVVFTGAWTPGVITYTSSGTTFKYVILEHI